MKDITRKQFILGMPGLVYGLISPTFAFGKESLNLEKIKQKFYQLPEEDLLAKMMLGETSGCNYLEKVYAGWTPFNRMNDKKNYTGKDSLTNVLFHMNQYNCFDFSQRNAENLSRILNPQGNDLKEWEECKEITKELIKGNFRSYNLGQTHFYKKQLVPKLERGELKINPTRLKPIKSNGFKHQFYQEV